MSDYVTRYRKEYAALEPFPETVRRWNPWVIWVIVLPLAIFCAIQFFS